MADEDFNCNPFIAEEQIYGYCILISVSDLSRFAEAGKNLLGYIITTFWC